MTNETITSYYEADHDRLDKLFQEFQRSKRTDFAKAKNFYCSLSFPNTIKKKKKSFILPSIV